MNTKEDKKNVEHFENSTKIGLIFCGVCIFIIILMISLAYFNHKDAVHFDKLRAECGNDMNCKLKVEEMATNKYIANTNWNTGNNRTVIVQDSFSSLLLKKIFGF